MAITKALLLLGLVALARGQQLNGHINPLWVSSTRRDNPAARSPLQQDAHINSLWLSDRDGGRSPMLQLYYLDAAGSFRPLTLQSPSLPPLYRGSERSYDAGRTGRYEQLTTPYRNSNY